MKTTGPVSRIITISDQAIATSGDLFQYAEIEGKRYSHIVNPSTGLGLTDESRVTVIAPTGITADSYASAISVLGPQKSLDVVRNMPRLKFYFIRQEGEHYFSWETKGFKKIYINNEQASAGN